MVFKLNSQFEPAWDQPQAIKEITEAFRNGENKVTLLGATGTGKTFTMANVIKNIGKPTLILSHNKTLAAQLATEFKYFFPSNAVHYFVSYFDYYQPESFLPEKWVYIEKEATINQEIEMFRLSTMASLLSREDSIVVSSVSSLYGLWSREFFESNRVFFEIGKDYDFDELKQQLISIQYKPVHTTIEAWMFDVQGDMIDIYSSTEKVLYRLFFDDTTLEMIQIKDSTTYATKGTADHITIWPATQYMQDMSSLKATVHAITAEMEKRVAWFEKHNFLTEAQRLRKRVTYDMKMIQETGFVNGIENYSPYFENRLDGAPPNTLFDYFPEDCLVIVDESHMWVPQLWGMPRADASRKSVLIDHGFRLPSSENHRPINFSELEIMLGWKQKWEVEVHSEVFDHHKKDCRTLFVSATPAKYELENSHRVVQQVIRPTWLLDPLTYVYPKTTDYEHLMASIPMLLKKKPELNEFLDGYDQDTHLYL